MSHLLSLMDVQAADKARKRGMSLEVHLWLDLTVRGNGAFELAANGRGCPNRDPRASGHANKIEKDGYSDRSGKPYPFRAHSPSFYDCHQWVCGPVRQSLSI